MKRGTFKQKSYAEKLTSLKEKQARAIGKPKVKKNVTTGQITTNKRKPKTQAQLKKELDKLFSLYIRNKFPESCYTCGKKGTVKTLQCGHFISRQYLATRWHENNCRPQCAGCNLFGNGKPLDFEERLKKDLGNEYVEDMKKTRHQVLKLDRNWYIEQIARYTML